MASTITAACSGETRPATMAAWVAARSPTSTPAWRMVWWPVPRWVPARWAYQSAVDPHASSVLAVPRAWTSARTRASRAARCAEPFGHGDSLDQLGGGLRGPQGLVEVGDQGVGSVEYPGGGGWCLGGLLHDPTQPEATDSRRALTCGYPPERSS